MQAYPAGLGLGFREVIGAWIICLAVAAASFTVLAAASPGSEGQPEALISSDPTATVAAAANRAEAHQNRRC